MKRAALLLVILLLSSFPVFSQTEKIEIESSPDETTSLQPESWRYLAGLLPHEPMYLSFGWNEKTNARFQFSFKYRFVNSESSLANRSPWFRHMHFAYTQTSLWDIESDSAPFYDTSYRPSFFVFRQKIHTSTNGAWSMDLETGVEHESNGQGGVDSRSLNIAYVRPVFHLGEVLGSEFTVSPKIYAYISGLTDNPDVADYLGYVDLKLALTDDEGWKFETTLRKGTEAHYGSIQADITFPLDKVFRHSFDAFVHIQYFNGWGESLLSYNQKLPHQIRLGLMIIR